MRIGIIQQTSADAPSVNIERLKANIADVARRGAELVVLQELHNTPYFCQKEDVTNFDLAETIPGPSTAWLAEAARTHNVVIVASLFERRAPGLCHNTAVVIERDGTIAGRQRKMHIPDDPGYYEKFYFTPGDEGFHPIQTSVGRLGVQVCWDQWYPEGARLMALQGAELLIYPTAIGYDSHDTPEEQQRQRRAWQLVQRGHAVANGLPLIAVNRVGFEPESSSTQTDATAGTEPGSGSLVTADTAGIKPESGSQDAGILFWGTSFVCGPQGELLAEASETEPENIVVDVDLRRSEQVRRWWPFLRDRRIDAYSSLTRRFID